MACTPQKNFVQPSKYLSFHKPFGGKYSIISVLVTPQPEPRSFIVINFALEKKQKKLLSEIFHARGPRLRGKS